MLRRLLLLVTLCLGGPAAAETHQVLPFDQAPQNPAFQQYRDVLLESVRARDLEAVLRAAAPDILLSFGGDEGRQTLRQMLEGTWLLEAEHYWRELEEILANGGGFDQEGGFNAPYWFAAEPPLPDDADWYNLLYVIGDKVRLRAGPGTDHPVLASLSYELVFLEQYREGALWIQIRRQDGQSGWMHADYLRSPIGYRAGFSQVEGSGDWLMQYFLAGD